MKKPTKHTLCHELEKTINRTSIKPPSEWAMSNNTTLIDVMGNVRRLSLKGLKTFGDLCLTFSNSVSRLCKSADRIDLVFDAYIDGSVKDSERVRRTTNKPVEISIISEQTPLPVNMESFWPANTNKVKLQNLIRKWILENASRLWPEKELVLSSIIEHGTCTACQSISNGNICRYEDLEQFIEEADVRLIPHAMHAIHRGTTRILILCSDTDVFVLGLSFWNQMSSAGLQELWMRTGVGDSLRYVPLHQIADQNQNLCKVLVAAHILTGCDNTS